ncbi:MAG: hypothetical protein NVSMB64_21650 [Candidatus Velthaea sp.]
MTEQALTAADVPRIVLGGAESTGKTTLARVLAARFDVPWVEEYGREYTLEKYREGMATDAWEPAEFVHIACEQQRREDAAAGSLPRCVIADTDAFMTAIWYERYLGVPPPRADWPADSARRRIYLIPEPDVPFVQDEIRDGETLRAWMHDRTLAELASRGAEAIVLRGGYDERTATAIAAVKRLLGS